MCLILFAYKHHPRYPFVLAANRDEFYERPTARARFWEDHPELLAGKDLKYGGTWLGITTSGRFGAVTNFRDRTEFRAHPLSRGLMVREFLTGATTPPSFLRDIISRKEKYNGFNLLLGDTRGLYYYSNRRSGMRPLSPGIYGLSNHLLDTPWPKLVRSREALAQYLTSSVSIDRARLFEILYDKTPAPDEHLPDTGFGVEWERILSSPFITSPTYGTRASTVLIVDREGCATFEEHAFDGCDSPAAVTSFVFSVLDSSGF